MISDNKEEKTEEAGLFIGASVIVLTEAVRNTPMYVAFYELL